MAQGAPSTTTHVSRLEPGWVSPRYIYLSIKCAEKPVFQHSDVASIGRSKDLFCCLGLFFFPVLSLKLLQGARPEALGCFKADWNSRLGLICLPGRPTPLGTTAEGVRRSLHSEGKHICVCRLHLQTHAVLPSLRGHPGGGPQALSLKVFREQAPNQTGRQSCDPCRRLEHRKVAK